MQSETNWHQLEKAKAFEEYKKLGGIPSKRLEDWRYSDISQWGLGDLKLTSVHEINSTSSVKRPSLDSVQVVFINGRISFEHTDLSRLHSQVEIVTKEKITSEHLSSIDQFTNYQDPMLQHALAFNDNVVIVDIKDNVKQELPIYFLFYQESHFAFPSRVVFLAGKNSKANVVVGYYSLNGRGTSHSLMDFKLKQGSEVNFFRIQNENFESRHLSQLRANLSEASHFNSYQFSVGSISSRQNLWVELNGKDAFAELNGLSISQPKQTHDQYVAVFHNSPEAKSSQLFKSILSQSGRSIFNGKIVVKRDAQKTDAKQLNKNLLLGSQAEALTRPQLEIDADDVKCSHGATIGRVNQEELFYLQSRGLSTEKALDLVARGFTQDLVLKIKNPSIQSEILNQVREAFSSLRVGL